jgi:hypothetical protein
LIRLRCAAMLIRFRRYRRFEELKSGPDIIFSTGSGT